MSVKSSRSKFLLKFTFLISILLTFFSCKEKEEPTEYKYTNDLINETSPYLLQHAHNPVEWRPWSQNALEEAKNQNKLVLISIGYSSCHWCHVMEEETFEDEDVAKLMNENFINIKIDREERPDLDQVYMTALQLMKGSGGWPLNIIALPNGKPLYGGTYHTKEEWTNVLSKVNSLYKKDPVKADEYANNVAKGINEVNLLVFDSDPGELTQTNLEKSISNWKPKWDLKQGGDLGSQKFMLPGNLEFLLEYSSITGDLSATKHLKETLQKIAIKGVFDHVDGGFFRYSTDERWELPHFEKMLYDNAQLISLYSKSFKRFKDPLYKKIVVQTIKFLKTEMKNPEGGFYASIDADVNGEEGAYYIWEKKELENLIKNDFDLFSEYFNIKERNKFEENKFHLFKNTTDSIFRLENALSVKELDQLKEDWQGELKKERTKRSKPSKDDKIIVSWNALLIVGLVDAYTAIGNKEYLELAISTFDALNRNAYVNKKLVHSYKANSNSSEGFLEDYAYLEKAALSLYSVTMEDKFLKFARNLNNTVIKEYDHNSSELFTYNNHDKLISELILTNDGVMPSPNAVMAENLFILGHIDYNEKYTQRAEAMLSTLIPYLEKDPANYSKWNSLLLKTVYPYNEIAVVGKQAENLLIGLHQNYLPNALIVGTTSPSNYPLFDRRFIEDETYIYVCEERTCKRPVKTVEEAIFELGNF